MVGSFVDVLQTRSSTHVAFVDIRKTFDMSCVDATLVLFHEAGVTWRLWGFSAHVLRHTQSQVRLGALLSVPWEDRGVAQGRLLSPLLFDLPIDGLTRAVHESAPGEVVFKL